MYTRIVVPLDGSSLAECVLPHAVAFSQALGARLVILRVTESGRLSDRNQPTDPIEWEALRAEAPAYMDAIASRLRSADVEVETVALEGDPAERIVDFVRTEPNTLLVMSSHGSGGITGLILGSVAQKSVLHAHVSLLLVRAFGSPAENAGALRYGRIVVPMDRGKRSECVLPVVEALARRHGSEVVLATVLEALAEKHASACDRERSEVLRAIERDERLAAQAYVDALAQRLQGEDLSASVCVVQSDCPEATLHQVARQERADLMVISAHGTECVAHWPFGRVTLNMLVYGECPLLVVQDLAPEEIAPTRAERVAREVWGH